MISSQNFQFQYTLPQNLTISKKIQEKSTVNRHQTSTERSIFYQFVEQELQRLEIIFGDKWTILHKDHKEEKSLL